MIRQPLVYHQIFLVAADIQSENANPQGASASMTATILTNLAQIIMHLAIAISTTALKPGMLDQAEQSLILLGSCRLWTRWDFAREMASGDIAVFDIEDAAPPSLAICELLPSSNYQP